LSESEKLNVNEILPLAKKNDRKSTYRNNITINGKDYAHRLSRLNSQFEKAFNCITENLMSFANQNKSENDGEFYGGCVVGHIDRQNDGETLYIYDGQQRITTLAVLSLYLNENAEDLEKLAKYSFVGRAGANKLIERIVEDKKKNKEPLTDAFEIDDATTNSIAELLKIYNAEKKNLLFINESLYKKVKFDFANIARMDDVGQLFVELNEGLALTEDEEYKAKFNHYLGEIMRDEKVKDGEKIQRRILLKMDNDWIDCLMRNPGTEKTEKTEETEETKEVKSLKFCVKMAYAEKNGFNEENKDVEISDLTFNMILRVEQAMDKIAKAEELIKKEEFQNTENARQIRYMPEWESFDKAKCVYLWLAILYEVDANYSPEFVVSDKALVENGKIRFDTYEVICDFARRYISYIKDGKNDEYYGRLCKFIGDAVSYKALESPENNDIKGIEVSVVAEFFKAIAEQNQDEESVSEAGYRLMKMLEDRTDWYKYRNTERYEREGTEKSEDVSFYYKNYKDFGKNNNYGGYKDGESTVSLENITKQKSSEKTILDIIEDKEGDISFDDIKGYITDENYEKIADIVFDSLEGKAENAGVDLAFNLDFDNNSNCLTEVVLHDAELQGKFANSNDRDKSVVRFTRFNNVDYAEFTYRNKDSKLDNKKIAVKKSVLEEKNILNRLNGTNAVKPADYGLSSLNSKTCEFLAKAINESFFSPKIKYSANTDELKTLIDVSAYRNEITRLAVNKGLFYVNDDGECCIDDCIDEKTQNYRDLYDYLTGNFKNGDVIGDKDCDKKIYDEKKNTLFKNMYTYNYSFAQIKPYLQGDKDTAVLDTLGNAHPSVQERFKDFIAKAYFTDEDSSYNDEDYWKLYYVVKKQLEKKADLRRELFDVYLKKSLSQKKKQYFYGVFEYEDFKTKDLEKTELGQLYVENSGYGENENGEWKYVK
jgi:hypothetical protein